MKAFMAELYGKLLQTKLHKYMSYKNTKSFADVFDKAVDSLNNRKIKALNGLAPADLSYDNQKDLYRFKYPKTKKQTHRIKIGQNVILSKKVLTFGKSYLGNWITDKTYRVVRIHPHDVARYTIADNDDDVEIVGTFYANQLQPVKNTNIL
jgi:hypothetical protein